MSKAPQIQTAGEKKTKWVIPPPPPQPRGITDVQAALRVLNDYFKYRAIK